MNEVTLPLISIIMPVYNAAKTIEKSILSVLNQSYSNWELICINDGSTDSSLEILNKYSSLDLRIKILSQQNSGPTLARFLAYETMTGDFVYLLDSDDQISENLLQQSLGYIFSTNADAAIPELMVQKSNHSYSPLMAKNKFFPGDVLTGQRAFEKTFPWKISTFCLWKRDVVLKAFKELPKPINNYNSDEFLSRLKLLQCSRIVISPGFHFYNYNFNSITKKFSQKTLLALETNESILQYVERKNFSKKTVHLILSYQLRTVFVLLKNLTYNKKSLSHTEYHCFLNFILVHYKNIPRIFFPIVDSHDFLIKFFNLLNFNGLRILSFLILRRS